MKTSLMTSFGHGPLALVLTAGAALAEPYAPAEPRPAEPAASADLEASSVQVPAEVEVHSYRLTKPPGGGGAANPDPAARLRSLERELADLNAASDRRRAELMKQMAATRAAVERKKVARQHRQTRSLTQWMNAATSPPEWVVGVAIKPPGEEGEGIVVEQVMEDKAGARAGLQAGDVIRSCNGIVLRSREALVQIIQAAQDQELRLLVQRGSGENGKELEVAVTPERSETAPNPKAGEMMQGFGLQLDPRTQLSQPGGSGGWQAIPGGGQVPFTYYSYVNPQQQQGKEELEEIKKLLQQLLQQMNARQAE